MPLTDNQSRERIRDLNDRFRKTLDPMLGRMMLTAGVDGLPIDVRAMAIRKVVTFDAFSADNDPHGELTSAASISRTHLLRMDPPSEPTNAASPARVRRVCRAQFARRREHVERRIAAYFKNAA